MSAPRPVRRRSRTARRRSWTATGRSSAATGRSRPATPLLVLVTATAALLLAAGVGLPWWGSDAATDPAADPATALSDWKSWQPPASSRRLDFSKGPWDDEGRLAGRRPDACGLLTRKEVSSIVPEVTKVTRLDESDPDAPGTGTCTVIVYSESIPTGDVWFGPYTFRLTTTVSRPGTTSREAAEARRTSEFRPDHTDYGRRLGGKAAWGSGGELWLQASDEVLVDLTSVGATNGVGWLASADEVTAATSDAMSRKWRAAVFTKIAKVLAQKIG